MNPAHRALAINLPEPGKYVEAWKRLRSIVETGHNHDIWVQHRYATAKEHLADISKALTNRINARGGIDTSQSDAHHQLMRDQQKLFDFRNRIMHRGSGFETAVMQKRFPDVHAALRAPLE